MKEQIAAVAVDKKITEYENLVRDKKRILVNQIAENILQLKLDQQAPKVQTSDYMARLVAMAERRNKKLLFMQALYKRAVERKNEMQTWIQHSQTIATESVVRVCEQIVDLLQQKNLMKEWMGSKFIKVGVIEQKVGYKMNKSEPTIDDPEAFLLRKLQTECTEREAKLKRLIKDAAMND